VFDNPTGQSYEHVWSGVVISSKYKTVPKAAGATYPSSEAGRFFSFPPEGNNHIISSREHY
jgi:hypothetical protein